MTKEELNTKLKEQAQIVILKELQTNPNERRLNDLNQGLIPMIGFYTVCEFINMLSDQIVDGCTKYSVESNRILLEFEFTGARIYFTQSGSTSFYYIEFDENIKSDKDTSNCIGIFTNIFNRFIGKSNFFM